MPSSEEQQLLNDVLRDADYAAFRAETYEMSLAEFNGGRQRPLTGILLAVAAVALVAVLALSLKTQKEPPTDRPVIARTPEANATSPESFLVNSSPLPPAQIIRSVADQGQVIHTQVGHVSAVPFVRSNPATLSPMQDTELLALFLSDSLGVLRTAKGDNLYYFLAQRPRLQ